MVSRSSAVAHVRLNQACRRPTVYPLFLRITSVIHLSTVFRMRMAETDQSLYSCSMDNGAQYSESLAQLRARTIEQCLAAQQRTGKQLVFTHSTALCLQRTEMPRYPDQQMLSSLHALATDNNARTHLQNVQFELWTGPIIETATHYGKIRHTDPVTTWAMHANRLPQEELITLGDSMLRRNQRFPQVCIDDFHEYLERLKDFSNYANANRQRPIRGIRTMQHALQFMREGTDSSQESRCRIALIRNGLPCPKVNWKVRLNNGKIALLDMAYPDIKVAIEYDGRHHAGQWLVDSKRREALEDDGWAYIQVTAENLMNDFEKTGTRATRGRPDEPTIKQAHHALSKNVLGKDTHPHNVSRQWKQKDSHLKATICGRFAIPRKTKTAICGRPDRFQASKDPNQYPLDEIFLGRLPHITEIIFLKCQKLPHIGHFKLKTRHRHITFFVRSKTAFRKRHHHRRRGYRFCGGRVRAAIRRVPYRRAHGCRDATACAFRPPPR